jgi:hypothetical protein
MSDHKKLFAPYFKELLAVAGQGDAREESFYPALADLLTVTAEATGRKHVRVTTLPKATDAGNPDFRLWNGLDRIVGYVEAKKPSEERLDAVEKSEQLQRYRRTFPNLILTNFFEFRLSIATASWCRRCWRADPLCSTGSRPHRPWKSPKSFTRCWTVFWVFLCQRFLPLNPWLWSWPNAPAFCATWSNFSWKKRE